MLRCVGVIVVSLPSGTGWPKTKQMRFTVCIFFGISLANCMSFVQSGFPLLWVKQASKDVMRKDKGMDEPTASVREECTN